MKQPLNISFSLLLSAVFIAVSACGGGNTDPGGSGGGVTTDTTAPVITLTGDNPQQVEVGTDYVELGATASDNIDGNITANITIDASAANTASITNFDVVYSVSDAAGNASSQTRVVNVVDTTAPVITVLGDNPQTVDAGSDYIELGATSQDNLDGDISNGIIIDTSNLVTSTPGTYEVVYISNDNAGNSSAETREVIVVEAQAGIAFIRATNGTTGRELYKSDGTAEGTEIVKDINPDGDSNPGGFFQFGSELFFRASDGQNGNLWKSDGTDSGTVKVKQEWPGGTVSNISNFFDFNGTLYFNAFTNDVGIELWKTDGTDSGTVLVKDINPNTSGSNPDLLTSLGENLYFRASDGTGTNVWKTDGTEAGTEQLIDLSEYATVDAMISFNGTLFFIARSASNATLFKSDGSTAGTVEVNTLQGTRFRGFIPYNGQLYFYANGSLWVTDGTDNGTDRIISLNTNDSVVWGNFIIGGNLYLSIEDEIWKTDGTENGTVLVVKNPGGLVSADFVNVNGNILFNAYSEIDQSVERELWITDGTADGTKVLKNINGDASAFVKTYNEAISGNKPILLSNGSLLFGAFDDVNGRELWISDGTEAGTLLLKDINPGASSGF